MYVSLFVYVCMYDVLPAFHITFLGTQPTLTHVPPRSDASINPILNYIHTNTHTCIHT